MLRRGFVWIALYLIALVASLAVVIIGERPPGRDFWTEFAVALGFLGLAILMLQFLVTARIQPVSWPFGIDVVLHFHRRVAVLGFLFLLAHPLILAWQRTWNLLNPIDATAAARYGQVSIVVLAILIGLSLWRIRLKLSYEAWHLTHTVLAVAVIAFAFGHILSTGLYLEAAAWKEALWVAAGAALALLLAYTRVLKPILMMRRAYKVVRVVGERGEAWTIELEPDGHEGIQFHPGQFGWLKLGTSPFGFGEHPFSFSSVPEHPDRLRFTIKEMGDFTSHVKDVPPGTKAYIDGPFGAFTFDRYPAPGYVFIAGGIGITPIMSMLRALAHERDRRPLLLIYANKSWDEVTYRDELPELQAKLRLRIVHVLEDPPDKWDGETGFVTREVLERHLPSASPERAELQYFVCGPPAMLTAVRETLVGLEIPLTRIQVEEFALV